MTSRKKTGGLRINIKGMTHSPGGNRGKGRNKPKATGSGSGDSPNTKQRDGTNSPVKVGGVTPWTSKLQDEILSFIEWIVPTAVEHQTRLLVIKQIRQQVFMDYPGATVIPSGSFVTGLYLPEGDIDIVVQLNADDEVVPALKTIAERLRASKVGQGVRVIDRVRVPIIKLNSVYGDFPIDIPINQQGGIRTGKLVNQWLHELPALRGMVMTVKVILSRQLLNEVYKGGTGSFTVILGKFV
ncbi:hypothetical protein FRC03_001583 [Tulasnella sp. 419]|nr:hypothetical protein FRC03_001583 [Tulasnella sp. 419]